MLTLLLIRHAKAVAGGREHDYSRDLTEAGTADALRLGVYLASNSLTPNFAFVSSALRTRRTYELIQAKLQVSCGTRFEEALYNATSFQLRDLLKLADPAIRTLMIVGHNPGIMDVAVMLARDGDPTDLRRITDRFPPCALAVLSFESEDWQDARSRGGRLDALLLPENIGA